jgi:serine/threonine protein phosphatase 1
MISLRTLLGGKRAAPQTAPGERLYVVGDVHGRPDLLERMFAEIERDDAQRARVARRRIVTVGDIVDRGPDPCGAMQVLETAQQRLPDLITVLGNHEEMLLRAMRGDEATIRGWMRVGGAETAESFGVAALAEGADAVPFVAALNRAVPEAWERWMQSWPLTFRSGDYFVCHAGIRPGVALAKQNRNDLLWAREAFLGDTRDYGAIIVHGHTITEEVELLPNRIGIDTGAYRSGILSAVCLDGPDVAVLAVHGDPGRG